MPKPLIGDAAARKIAARIEARRQEVDIKADVLVRLLGLGYASAWSKRIRQRGDKDWVPFKLNEILTLRPLLAPPDQPDWPFVEPRRPEPTPPPISQAAAGNGDFTESA